MANMIYILVQQILMIVMNFFALTGNGFILYLIFTNKSLRKNQNLYLITALTAVDFIVALTIYPYLIFLLSGWSMEPNYPALPILCLVTPSVTGLRVCQIFDIAIAVDRLMAIQWPINYRLRNHIRYTAITLLIAFSFAAVDVAYIFITTEMKPHPGCPAAGCFMSDAVRTYSAISDTCVNPIGLIATVLVIIRSISLKNNGASANLDEAFKRANRTAIGVLICSSITILLPGALVAIGPKIGFDTFQRFGPSAAFGVVANTTANPFIYGFRHRDIYEAFRNMRNKNRVFVVNAKRIATTISQS